MVEIEFSDNPEVIRTWKALFEHFGQPRPRHHDEELPDGLGEAECLEREKRYNVRIGQERYSLLSKLLHAIGKDLGFKIEQLEIFEGGYTPQGWGAVEDEQTAVRRLFTDIALGRRMFPSASFTSPICMRGPVGKKNRKDRAGLKRHGKEGVPSLPFRSEVGFQNSFATQRFCRNPI